MKAIALLGSPRKGGNTDLLAGEVLRACEEAGAVATRAYLDELSIRPIGPMVDDMPRRVDDRTDDDWTATVAAIMGSDIVVWASPVYWQGVTAQMKLLVDRFSTKYVDRDFLAGMRGKVWVVVTTHTAPNEGHWVLEPIRVWAKHFRATVVGELDVTVAGWGAVAEMQEVMAEAYDLGRRAVGAYNEIMNRRPR
jgi:multimeric flavodoxin WrbA